jgi:hypothetical protein
MLSNAFLSSVTIKDLNHVFTTLATDPPPTSIVSPFLQNGIDTVPLLGLSVALATYLGYVRAGLAQRVSVLRKEREETRRWINDHRNQNQPDEVMRDAIILEDNNRLKQIIIQKEQIGRLKFPDVLLVIGAICLLIEPLHKGLDAITQDTPPDAPWSFVLGMIALIIAVLIFGLLSQPRVDEKALRK